MKKKNTTTQRKVSVAEFIANHNPVQTRRGKTMDSSYIYRLIRADMAAKKIGTTTRPLWFKYVLEGEKDHIFILVEDKK